MSNIWCKNKGLDDFLSLSRNRDFVVMLVGLTNEQVELFKTDEYKDCNLVPICRTQNQQELAMIYSMADVFVNLTYADMFPTVNLEALACGTPVITYRTGGSPEALDESCGVVVEQGNIKEIISALNKMRIAPLNAAACRKRAEDSFDKDKCFEAYIALYESLLKRVNI